MKKIGLILIFGLLAAAPLSAQDYKGVISFQTTELREAGDSLVVDLGIYIHSGAIAKCQSMRLTPELADGLNSLEMPYLEIQGKQRGRLNDRWEALRSKKLLYEEPYGTVRVNRKHDETTDTLIVYKMTVPYEMWMDDARLVVHQEVIGCYNEFRLFTFSMNNTVKLEPREAYAPTFEVVLVEPVREEKRRSKQGQAFLDFPVNQSVIQPNYRRNPEELAKIEDAFYDIKNNRDVQIRSLYVQGFASPEGRYNNNDRLARERSYALKDYMKHRFGLMEDMFKVDYTAEDWDGLKAMIAGSDIAYKDEIINIIETTGEPDARESKLMRLRGGAPWRTMLRDMFPMLRRVEYQIDYSVKDFTVDEIVTMIGVKDDLLSHREFYLGARSFGKGTPQYEEILIDRVLRYFPDDPTALNNAAAVLIERGELVTAKRYLDRAGDTPAVWNNIGVVYLLSGELDQAEAIFRQSAAAGIAHAQSNLEQVRLKREDNVKMERYKNR